MNPTPDTIDPPHAVGDRYAEALGFLYNRINYENLVRGAARYPFRLQRIKELLLRLDLGQYLHGQAGSPKVPLVHIAGTKGKGSTAAMVSAALTAGGIRTGLYTSPHLHRLEERFRVDGQPCSPQHVIDLVDRLKPVAEALEESVGPPSFFELTTAMAVLHFDTFACDAIVLEVGLGGRLDSTNVFAPSVSAITSIGLDHQHVLGNSRREIAAEKAGIFKSTVPVVSGVTDREAAEVIRSAAADKHCRLLQLGEDFNFHYQPSETWGSQVIYLSSAAPLSERVELSLAMEGEHQASNAAVAIAIIDLLRDQGVQIDNDAVARGLGSLQCEGRIEHFVLHSGASVIVDSAHNEDSIDALCDCLDRRCQSNPIHVVFGTSIDKSAGPMLERLSRVADNIVLTRFHGNPRFRPPQDLVPLVPRSLAAAPRVIEDPIEACQHAMSALPTGATLVICGSFFLAAETRAWVEAQRQCDGGDPQRS